MQLLVVSGKGGTGKTTLAATFTELGSVPLVVDCDVEASNLHLLLSGKERERRPFSGAKLAHELDNECIKCGICTETCRFSAIVDGQVDPLRCEGCGACVFVCPVEHLALQEAITGDTILAGTAFGLLSRAEMEPGAEGSGKLVTEIRRRGRLAAPGAELTLLDGPPGIGCAVIASMTGCRLALVVAEASLSGLRDAERILLLLKEMRVKACLAVNKADVSPEYTAQLAALAKEKGIPVIGFIPFDPSVQEALRKGESLLAYPESPACRAIVAAWGDLQLLLKEAK